MKYLTMASKQAKQCRYCERPIPVFRSFLASRFCCVAHERLSQREMDGMMLERLKVAAQRLVIASRRTYGTALPGM